MLGECVGVQDQATAALGGFNVLEFRAEDDIRVTPLQLTKRRLEEVEQHLFLVFTGIKRRAHNLEAKKLQNIGMNVEHLRQMRRMVDRGYDLLVSEQELSKFGALLHEAWTIKRRLDGCVTNPEIDSLYDRGIAAGAWGGKLLGAGGGGFLVFLVPPDKRVALAAAFAEKHEIKVGIAAPGSQIIFS
jgi:D-glycero-alpha-D-manno-heptose-7-phosphate kinase